MHRRRYDTRIAPFHPDGTTPETPTWIWSVAVGGQLNRSPPYNGAASRRYQPALGRKAAQIRALAVLALRAEAKR